MSNVPFSEKSLRTVCSEIAHENIDDDVKKTMDIFLQMKQDDPYVLG